MSLPLHLTLHLAKLETKFSSKAEKIVIKIMYSKNNQQLTDFIMRLLIKVMHNELIQAW